MTETSMSIALFLFFNRVAEAAFNSHSFMPFFFEICFKAFNFKAALVSILILLICTVVENNF